MPSYQNLLIYYFSGTGNALTGAKWIKTYAESERIKCSLYSIENIKNIEIPELSGKTLIGFCYPTHGFAPSWIVLKFMFRFPKIKNADAFILNTRGAFKIYKLLIPGISGLALWLPVLILCLKKFSVKGILPLDMPINWTSFFPPVNRTAINSLVARSNRIVNDFCEKIFNAKRYYRYSIWISLLPDLSLIPVSIIYIFWGRFFLAKTLYASYHCNDCKICAINCPVQAITIKYNRPYWSYRCESCMRCMNICPAKAIQSWVSRLFIFTYLLFILFVVSLGINGHLFHLMFILLFFPFYSLLHRILGVRLINILFHYSSLTKYWNRYLVPGIKINQLKGK